MYDHDLNQMIIKLYLDIIYLHTQNDVIISNSSKAIA